MRISTSNGKRITHRKTQRPAGFKGTGLSVDHDNLPVGLEFTDAFNEDGTIDWCGGSVLLSMTIEEAEHVHRALGDLIALRKRQAAAWASMKAAMTEAK